MKRLFGLVLVIVMLGGVSALASDTLYTVSVPRTLVTITLEAAVRYLAQEGQTPEDVIAALQSDQTVSLDTDRTVMQVSAAEMGMSFFQLLSVSPDGETSLYAAGNNAYSALVIVRGNQATVVSMDLSRSEHDETTGFDNALKFMQLPISRWTGLEGWVWSPDSKYVYLNDVYTNVRQMRNLHGLTLLDVDAGELVVARNYGKVSSGHFNVALQAAFYLPWEVLFFTERASDIGSGVVLNLVRFSDMANSYAYVLRMPSMVPRAWASTHKATHSASSTCGKRAAMCRIYAHSKWTMALSHS